MKKKITVLLLVMILCLTASGCIQGGDADTNSIGGTESTNSINSTGGAGEPAEERTSAADADLQNIPPYTDLIKRNLPQNLMKDTARWMLWADARQQRQVLEETVCLQRNGAVSDKSNLPDGKLFDTILSTESICITAATSSATS